MSSILSEILKFRKFSQIKKHIYEPEPEELIHASPPLDHSFKKIYEITDARDNPRVCRLYQLPPLGKSGKYVTRSLWLDNNVLIDLQNIEPFVERQFDQPDALMWLDLSFNKLCDVPKEIFIYPNLKILYLHGNNIKALTPLAVLQKVKTLQSLTLRGNPVEKIYAFRILVIALLPHLVRLDYALITDYERRALLPVSFGANLVKQLTGKARKSKIKF